MDCCLWMLAVWGVVAGFQSEEEELVDGPFSRNRKFNQQVATSYGGNTVYYNNPSQSLLSKNVCRGRTGYVADTSRNCQVFYNCLADGTVTTSTCPGNYQFDETSQCCRMPHDVNCEGLLDGGSLFQPTISCTGKRGFFPDIQSGCQIFYFCEPSGRSRQLSCPDGLLFNEIIGCCDVAQHVNCGGQVRYPPVTSSPTSDGGALFCRNSRPGFYAIPTDCSTYYYCQAGGQSSLLRCPSGQAFNERSSSCDNDLSRCYGVQVDVNVFDCTGRNGWYQGNDPNCRLAYYCNAGSAYQHSCPVNQRWNTFSLSCDSPDRVQCGNDHIKVQQPIVPLATARPTAYNVLRPGASAYGGNFGQNTSPTSRLPGTGFVAQTYPSVTLTTNPSGYGHFGTVPRDVYSNPGLGIDNNYDCRGKIGYYAIQETGCSQFIYCNPEGIPHKFDCPSTLLFNNSLAVCDWPQNVQCTNQVLPGYLPSPQLQPNFDCRGKDGFYADQNRGGRIFYLCHADGIKYQYVCPSNLVFNEETSVCDWPDYMKAGGFIARSPSDLSQSLAVDWNGQPLDCRVRPAGFYANPANNQVYARCTPDGTFIPMRCPQTTVFDQALGQCVFPFQLGQSQGTGGTYGGSNTVPTNQGNGVVNYAVQGGTYGQGTGGQDTGNGLDGINYAVQNGLYGQRGTGVNEERTRITPAVQGGTYGQGTSGQNNVAVDSVGNGNPRVNYAVQGGLYGTSGQGVDQARGTNGFGYSITPTPATSHFRPYKPQGFYTSTPNNLPETYFSQIGGHNVPLLNGQPGYVNQRYPDGQENYYTTPGYGSGTFYGYQRGVDYTTQGYGTQPGYHGQNSNTDQTNWGNMFYGNQVESPIGYGQQQRPAISIGITINSNGGSGQRRTTPVVCIGRTGIFADRTTQCRSYTICRADGTSETRTCNANLVFSEQVGACDNSQNTNCFANAPGIMQPNVPVCMTSGNSLNTFVPDTTQSCMTFYSCEQNGQGIGFRCPSGMQFNSRINACDDPRNCNCAAGNGGTITVRIPVATPLFDSSYNTAYSSNNHQVNMDNGNNVNQNIDLDITVRKQQQLSVGTMPLVPGYDHSLYADSGGSRSRVPSFFSDDASVPVMSNISADLVPTGVSQDEMWRATEQAALLQMAAAESARIFASKVYLTQNSTTSIPTAVFSKPKSRYRDLKRDPSRPFGSVLQALAAARRNQHLAELGTSK